ncbi:efflux RND transporter periplasmic adaptor subunit [Roseomonas sp. 18066]|uniref:efflux RND transporter periplasmic adaptor subunit n=1 Tax=Roseomonas sp. 18066 TaxID=2681412 RepID=UPI00135991C1|nr:efflux RND transporter periplasmic adaptor subunit [Roseomonas sp. 18066]
MSTRRLPGLLALILCLAGGIAIGHFFQLPWLGRLAAPTGTAPPPVTPQVADRAEQAPAAVETTRVRRGPVETALSAIGTLRARQSVPVASLTGGSIVASTFIEGTEVAAGVALVEFDKRIAQAQLDAATGQLAIAQVRFSRGQQLSVAGVRSRQAQDDDQASLDQAQSELAVRRTTLDQLTLRAPFRGVAGQKFFGIGEYAPAGKTLLWLEDRTVLRLDFRLPERFLPSVAIGQTFQLSVDAVPGRQFEGRIVLIDTRPDLNERNIQLRGEIDNTARLLTSGLFGRVRLVIAQRPAAIILPPAAVQYTLTGASVFRIVDGRARRVPVTIGVQMADRVEILDGLAEGDEVVTIGQFNLDEGRRVTITTPATPAAAPGTTK